MAFSFVRFAGDRRGTTFEGIALSVAVIAVAFVASADMLDYLVKKHTGDTATVSVASASVPKTTASNLDYTPTSTVPQLVNRSVLDPCTGTIK